MKFKYCWVSHEKIHLGDDKKTYTLPQSELIKILNKTKLKATLQRKNYKLEVPTQTPV